MTKNYFAEDLLCYFFTQKTYLKPELIVEYPYKN